jgi:hypothetical protein
MDREKVLQALREAQAEYNIENLDEFIKKAWEEVDIVDAQIVAELTERAVEILFDQDFLWVHIIESEDVRRVDSRWMVLLCCRAPRDSPVLDRH